MLEIDNITGNVIFQTQRGADRYFVNHYKWHNIAHKTKHVAIIFLVRLMLQLD